MKVFILKHNGTGNAVRLYGEFIDPMTVEGKYTGAVKERLDWVNSGGFENGLSGLLLSGVQLTDASAAPR